MTDKAMPVGQFVPPILTEPIAPPPVQAKNEPVSSFDQILQSKSAQLRPKQTTFGSAAAKSGSISKATLLPQSYPGQGVAGAAFERGLIQNLQDYNTMKAGTPVAANGASQPQPLAQPQFPSPLQQTRYPSPEAVQRNVAMNTSKNMPRLAMIDDAGVDDSHAVHSAMASTMQPTQQSPDDVQPVILTPEEARELEKLMNMNPASAGNVQSQTHQAKMAEAKMSKRDNESNMETETGSKEKKSFLGAMGSFFKNLASGLSLGFYQPDNQPAPTGAMRVLDPFKKIFFDAPKNLFWDAPVGIANSIESSGSDSHTEETSTVSRNRRYGNRKGMRAGSNFYARKFR